MLLLQAEAEKVLDGPENEKSTKVTHVWPEAGKQEHKRLLSGLSLNYGHTYYGYKPQEALRQISVTEICCCCRQRPKKSSAGLKMKSRPK